MVAVPVTLVTRCSIGSSDAGVVRNERLVGLNGSVVWERRSHDEAYEKRIRSERVTRSTKGPRNFGGFNLSS